MCATPEGITFENVTLNAKSPDYRPAMVFDDAAHILLSDVRIDPAGQASR